MIVAAVAIELCAGCSNRCFAYDFSYACLPLDIFIIYLVAAPRTVAIPDDGAAGLWGGKGSDDEVWHETLRKKIPHAPNTIFVHRQGRQTTTIICWA